MKRLTQITKTRKDQRITINKQLRHSKIVRWNIALEEALLPANLTITKYYKMKPPPKCSIPRLKARVRKTPPLRLSKKKRSSYKIKNKIQMEVQATNMTKAM